MLAKAERTVEALRQAVGAFVAPFPPSECIDDFKAAGYDAD